MSNGELFDLIARAAQTEQQDLANEALLPHLVACRDGVTGAIAYSGPYPTKSEAAAAADWEAALESDTDSRLLFTIEPVYPPIGHHLTSASVGGAS